MPSYRPLCSRLRWLYHSVPRYTIDVSLCQMRKHNDKILPDAPTSKADDQKTTKQFCPLHYCMDLLGQVFPLTNNDANYRKLFPSPLNSPQYTPYDVTAFEKLETSRGDDTEKFWLTTNPSILAVDPSRGSFIKLLFKTVPHCTPKLP